VDDAGLRVDVLETLAPDAAFVAPAHQFPLGVVLAPERRAALIDWAARTGAVVV
jgi:GntR family transcriptional regulator / MocR family aminotransferase